jgi:hypothetical protein
MLTIIFKPNDTFYYYIIFQRKCQDLKLIFVGMLITWLIFIYVFVYIAQARAFDVFQIKKYFFRMKKLLVIRGEY